MLKSLNLQQFGAHCEKAQQGRENLATIATGVMVCHPWVELCKHMKLTGFDEIRGY